MRSFKLFLSIYRTPKVAIKHWIAVLHCIIFQKKKKCKPIATEFIMNGFKSCKILLGAQVRFHTKLLIDLNVTWKGGQNDHFMSPILQIKWSNNNLVHKSNHMSQFHTHKILPPTRFERNHMDRIIKTNWFCHTWSTKCSLSYSWSNPNSLEFTSQIL